jgi:hypothetical protein
MKCRFWFACGISVVFSLFFAVPLLAAVHEAPFDLPGPKLEIKVTRGNRTLPISQVPNLQPGDQMWLHPDLPENESVHYLLIAVFLRGSLNPPPNDWFTKVETWQPKVRKSGVNVTVPSGALQSLIFWAPDTGGGFTTVRTAVRARPGVFVRAAQDLYAADLTRSRLDAYIDAIKEIGANDPASLKKNAEPLSQTLYLKINESCFDLPTDQQEACLIQNPDNVVLNDAQSQSMVTALTSGSAADMINQISASSMMGGGAYSPYVGAIVDMVRIMGSMHTAQYAYIPAVAVMRADNLNLKLSSPPSFSNPKSVMVASLPPVAQVQFPNLRAVHPDAMLCLQQPSLLLSVEGAPLVFSTAYAHDMFLRVQDTQGRSLDLPASANAKRGGFIVDATALQKTPLTGGVTGELRGDWGFDSYSGPNFVFTNSRPEQWNFRDGETDAVTADTSIALHLQADSVVCVQKVQVTAPQGEVVKSDWTRIPPQKMDVSLHLNKSSQGLYTVAISQYGQGKPDNVPVHVYPPSAVITGIIIHAGDNEGELTGTRLNEVTEIDMGSGVIFRPGKVRRKTGEERVLLKTTANMSTVTGLAAGTMVTSHVHLKDGRVLDIPVTIAPARPRVQLLSKTIALNPVNGSAAIHLGNDGDLPQYGRMTFFLKSIAPPEFPRDQKIEVAATNGGFDTMLSLSDATLTLQDAQTVLAVLDPVKAFGPSAFGQLRFRPVSGEGVPGDWQPLTNLVRLPSLKDVHCPSAPTKPCTLSGDNLFLIDSVSNNQQFTHAVTVPLGFAANTMQVPRPVGTTLFLKLRDDPSTVDMVALPVLPASDQE